jgi:hypothetical protein
MKKLALLIIAIANTYIFNSCTDLYDCECVINGVQLDVSDSDKPCDEVANDIPVSKATSGNNATGTYCIER